MQKYRRTVDRTCVHVFTNFRSANTPFRPVPLIRLPPHTPLSHPLPPLRRRRIFLCCYCCCSCVKERECRSTVRLTELVITSLTLGVQILLSDECCPRFTMMASSLLLCCCCLSFFLPFFLSVFLSFFLSSFLILFSSPFFFFSFSVAAAVVIVIASAPAEVEMQQSK